MTVLAQTVTFMTRTPQILGSSAAWHLNILLTLNISLSHSAEFRHSILKYSVLHIRFCLAARSLRLTSFSAKKHLHMTPLLYMEIERFII